MSDKFKERKRTPVSHKVIEKRRRDRINRCLNELGKTVPMALAKQSSGKLEKAEILEMTVQYLRALHSADFPRGREKAELLAEFANYFHYGYHECMKNLVHYLTTVERLETKDTKYARILAFLQSKARLGAEPACPARERQFATPNLSARDPGAAWCAQPHTASSPGGARQSEVDACGLRNALRRRLILLLRSRAGAQAWRESVTFLPWAEMGQPVPRGPSVPLQIQE
ncbi:hairy and enhancer of split-related protein HELT [Echinops telfairi]|uniref:Hairy and enhancer of split-related protein HELT n=1 Tax=Echinops telfairi TaxID=9371 RepID=A0ABM0IBS5_ECHTE|nr:hairy and enhancer of split-related protein HELT [Echinops telfairi]